MLAVTGVPFLDANYLVDIKECIKDLMGSFFFYDPYEGKKFATEEAESGDDAEDDDDGIYASFTSSEELLPDSLHVAPADPPEPALTKLSLPWNFLLKLMPTNGWQRIASIGKPTFGCLARWLKRAKGCSGKS